VKVEEFIASGIIEAYVFDELSAEKRAEVTAMAEKNSEVRDAIKETEETFLAFTAKGSIEPPARIKSEIFNKLDLKAEDKKPIQIAKNTTKTSSIYPYLTAAASMIAIIGIVLSLYYRNQWLQSESRIGELITQNQTLAQQYDVVKNQAEQYAYNAEILKQPGIETVLMKGLDISPNALAYVHWNKISNEVFLNAKKMPANPEDFQYQLWAIVDGKPVDMGIFDVAGDMTSMFKMKPIEKASAFAVTLEPSGGSQNPTMDQMYVIGQI